MESLQSVPYLTQHASALIEGGHLYANEELTDIHYTSTQIALKVSASLREMGLATTLCAFIDDYNAPDTSATVNLARLEAQGFSPDVVFREKDYQDSAHAILATLVGCNRAKARSSTGDWHLKDDSFAKLMTSHGRPTCALLDAALYCHKQATYGGVCVTVLPDTHAYRTQQNNTKTILRAAGKSIPLLNIYFMSQDLLSLDFDY